MQFEDLRLSQPLLEAVRTEGYTEPTRIQSESIPHILVGRDVIGCAQTGTGKTAAFALPILDLLRGGGRSHKPRSPRARALILCPTRELAQQIHDSFATYGRNTDLRQTVVFGGVGKTPQVRAMRRGVDILVATPGRLLDLMNEGIVSLADIEILVLDEADRMLDMGFLPDIRRILAQITRKRQTLFFSATMPDPIRHLARDILHDPVHLQVTPASSAAPTIDHWVYHVEKPDKTMLLAHLLAHTPHTRALVFTRTKYGADRVVRQLGRAGVRAAAIHGNKSQNERTRVLAAFKSGQSPVLVATDIAARGLDVDDISHVINYDLPSEPETYVHRVGRTGRAGASGTALSFVTAQEHGQLREIERLIHSRLQRAVDPPAHEAPKAAPRPAAKQEPEPQNKSRRPGGGNRSRPGPGETPRRRRRRGAGSLRSSSPVRA